MCRISLRRAAGAVAVFVAVGVALLLGAFPASANALLVSTTPADGDVASAALRQVSLTFDEPVGLGLSSFRLVDARGTEIPVAAASHADGRSDTVILPMPEQMAEGTYSVLWRVVAADSHPVQGGFSFSVHSPTAGAVPPAALNAQVDDKAVAAVYSAIRWVSLSAFGLLVGAAYFVAVCWPAGAPRRGVLRLLWVSWATLLAATVGDLLVFGPYGAGRSLAHVVDPGVVAGVFGTRHGDALLVRVLLLGLVAASLVILPKRLAAISPEAWNRRAGAVLAGSALLALTWSIAGDSGAGPLWWLALPLDVVFLVATGVWLGSLAVLLAFLLRSGDVPAMQVAMPRFSRTAEICVGALLVTSLCESWRGAGSFPALVGTSYGWLLLAKVALALALVGIGAAARSWVRRHYTFVADSIAEKRRARRGPEPAEITRLQRLVVGGVAVTGVVFVVTAMLGSATPARAVYAAAAPSAPASSAAAPSASGTGSFDATLPFDLGGGHKGSVHVTATPTKVGKNSLSLTLRDPAGDPLGVAGVQAQLSLPGHPDTLPVPLKWTGSLGEYAADDITVPSPGRWQLSVTVRTSDVRTETVTTGMDVR